jgi:hypothetical protein
MAGSRRYFQYTSDTSVTYAVEIDEENGELASLGFAPIDTGAGGPISQGRILQVSGSRPLRMRYVNAQAVDGNGDIVRRRFWVGMSTAAAFTNPATTLSLGGLTFSITSRRGEEGQGIPAQDTGLTDGDVDDNLVVA